MLAHAEKEQANNQIKPSEANQPESTAPKSTSTHLFTSTTKPFDDWTLELYWKWLFWTSVGPGIRIAGTVGSHLGKNRRVADGSWVGVRVLIEAGLQ
jgi:hypothetical protein